MSDLYNINDEQTLREMYAYYYPHDGAAAPLSIMRVVCTLIKSIAVGKGLNPKMWDKNEPMTRDWKIRRSH